MALLMNSTSHTRPTILMSLLKRCFIICTLMLWALDASALFGPKCKTATVKIKPEWVEAGYEHNSIGNLHGFGHASYQKKKSYEELLANAENLARADLIKSLEVKVESKLNVQTQQSTQNKKVKFF